MAATPIAAIPGRVSLNRSEDALLSYLRGQPDEERFWHGRVRALDATGAPRNTISRTLDQELKIYAAERSVAAPEMAETLGGGHVSMRNLAELLLFTWTDPKPKKKAGNGGQ